MANEIVQTTLTIDVGVDKFEFTIPTLYDEIKVGTRCSEIRRQIQPGWNGFSGDLDEATAYTIRACATLDTLLVKSSVQWLWSPGVGGKPAVDSSKFPEDKSSTVIEIYQGFIEALRSFREERAAQQQLRAQEAVASQPNPG